jgi:anti-sigma B factor antagonist
VTGVSLIELEHAGTGWAILAVSGEIDVVTSGPLAYHLERLLERGDQGVVVNLSHTRFCDCSGLRALIRCHQHAHELGAQFRLVLPTPGGPVARLLFLLDIADLIPTYTSLDQALSDPAPAPSPSA